MAKHIDANLIKSTQSLYSDIDSCIDILLKARTEHNQENEGKALFRMEGLMVATLQQLSCIIDSLQQEQPEDISVPKWLLENIEDALRIQNNINNDKKSGETCQDRNIRGCLNGVRKILNGEELTGMERLEPLKKQLKVDLEREIEEYFPESAFYTGWNYDDMKEVARHFYELGLNARKEE